MYEAAEDSELLAQIVAKHATGRVLDVGTGSGILAQTAHDKGLAVTAVDIDEAVVAMHKNKPFTVLHSDRFTHVKGLFDTIVCNPPYLPKDDEGEDPRLYGGKKGYEYVNALLTEAKQHLAPHGQILFLISSLTKPRVVEKHLLTQGYAFEIIAREKLFMEELFVYKAVFAIGEPATLIGRGKRSLVYKTVRGAVKVSTTERAAKEALMLKKANTMGIGPRYFAHENNKLIMEYVAGTPFDVYIKNTRDVSVMRELLVQARKLDEIGMKKQELNRPGKNILVTNDKHVVMLDFERSIFTEKPNNVSALATWLGLVFGKEVHEAIAMYKKTYTKESFVLVLQALN